MLIILGPTLVIFEVLLVTHMTLISISASNNWGGDDEPTQEDKYLTFHMRDSQE